MGKDKKVMAIIRNAGYGCCDIGYPVLFFEVFVSECTGSSQVIRGKKADDFISAYQVYDIHDLNGKPVWVNDDDCMMTGLEPCIIGGK